MFTIDLGGQQHRPRPKPPAQAGRKGVTRASFEAGSPGGCRVGRAVFTRLCAFQILAAGGRGQWQVGPIRPAERPLWARTPQRQAGTRVGRRQQVGAQCFPPGPPCARRASDPTQASRSPPRAEQEGVFGACPKVLSIKCAFRWASRH